MNKTMKIIITLMLSIMIISVATNVLASNDIAGVTINPDVSAGSNSIGETGNKILGVIKVIGIFASIGILMIVGVKYMMGSAEEKAEYKKVMIPYIIGAVLLFGASAFAGKLVELANGLF